MARYYVRRKVEEKDLPQVPAERDSPMNPGWDMIQPLFAPPPQPNLLTSEEAPSDSPPVALPGDETAKPQGEARMGKGVSDSTEISDKASCPDGPIPLSLDSDGPAHDTWPSVESWTQLYERTCEDTATAIVSGNRE